MSFHYFLFTELSVYTLIHFGIEGNSLVNVPVFSETLIRRIKTVISKNMSETWQSKWHLYPINIAFYYSLLIEKKPSIFLYYYSMFLHYFLSIFNYVKIFPFFYYYLKNSILYSSSSIILFSDLNLFYDHYDFNHIHI